MSSSCPGTGTHTLIEITHIEERSGETVGNMAEGVEARFRKWIERNRFAEAHDD